MYLNKKNQHIEMEIIFQHFLLFIYFYKKSIIIQKII